MHAVIMAGGQGTRFWPLSRQDRPKQFLRLTGELTLLQQTASNIRPLVPPERTWVITRQDYVEEVRSELPGLDPTHVVGEPEGRNTAPAVALAARLVGEGDPSRVMVLLPADHRIGVPARMRATLEQAARIAAAHGVLVTIGIPPTRPETGFGYIRRGAPLEGEAAYWVDRFVEKPDRETAERYLAEGGYYWNSGCFIWRCDAIQEALDRHMPELARAMGELDLEADGRPREESLASVYRCIPSESIDYGVMEHAERVVVVPGDYGWSDVGSWNALAEVLEPDARGNVTLGRTLLVDCRGTIAVSQEGPLVAAVGVEGLAVVATEDAVLVVPADQVQRVREIVARLKEIDPELL
ncbi:MAG: mannose-1-phosphate guanylyltransferase [Nitrospirae bacterium]|nr:MAG: mannose-1-phosphate guanylyltransferase [Nitrospirota bacterium]